MDDNVFHSDWCNDEVDILAAHGKDFSMNIHYMKRKMRMEGIAMMI